MKLLSRALALLALFLAPPAFAQVTLAGADMRPSQSLDGAWHWSIDPYRDGKSGFHGGGPGSSSNRWADIVQADVAARQPTALFEFDMQRSPVAHLPGAWIGHAPEMRYYNGLVWYQRTFELPALAPGKRAFLRFGAVDYAADVHLNGKPVGTHRGGFTPFAFEVTGLLRAGSNQITVGVDSERRDADVPPPVTDWENYGGITRSVQLITVPETFVDDAWIRLMPRRPHQGEPEARWPGRRQCAGPRPHHRPRPNPRRPHRCRRPLGRHRARAARAAALVARDADALRRPVRGRRRHAGRPGRVSHRRSARERPPAQRQADLPARHFDARGGARQQSGSARSRPPRRARCSPRSSRASTAISSASPIIRTAK